MSLILNQAQAEAVYSAMCALNNAGGVARVIFHPASEGGKVVKVKQCEDFGYITVIVGFETVERYDHQAAFAAAYGLQTEGQKRRQERRERDEQYLQYGVEATRTGSRA